MSEWTERWYRHCKGCGQCNYADRTNTFLSDFFRGEVCSGCGEYAGDYISTETSRTVFLGTWWMPWTWHKFEHQVKNQASEDPNSPYFDSWLKSYHG